MISLEQYRSQIGVFGCIVSQETKLAESFAGITIHEFFEMESPLPHIFLAYLEKQLLIELGIYDNTFCSLVKLKLLVDCLIVW